MPDLGPVGPERVPLVLQVVVPQGSPRRIEVFRQAPRSGTVRKHRAPGDEAGNANGAIQQFVPSRGLVGGQIRLGQVHVGILPAVVIQMGEGAVIALAGPPDGVIPVTLIEQFECSSKQYLALVESGDRGRAACQQHVGGAVKLLLLAWAVSTHDGVPTPVNRVLALAVGVELQSVLDNVPCSWAVQHGGQREDVNHSRANPQLPPLAWDGTAVVAQPCVPAFGQAHVGFNEVQQALALQSQPCQVFGVVEQDLI